MGMGIGALMTGAGAGAGLEALLRRRLQERQMALAEQAQRENSAYRNRDLELRSKERADALADANYWRKDASDQRWQGIERQAAENLVQTKPVGGDISDPEANLLERTGNAGVIRAIPMAGETIEGGTPAPVRFRGFTPQEAGQREVLAANAADRIAAEKRSEELRRSLQEDSQRFQAGQTASNQAFQRQMADEARAAKASPASKPPTGTQRAAVKYFDRMKEAITDFATVSDSMAKQGLVGQLQAIGPNLTQTSEQRRYNNALARFTEARLRKDSGAAVPPEEYRKDLEVYGIRPGDDAETIKQKVRAMISTANALAIEAGNAAMSDQYGEDWRGILNGIVDAGSGGDIKILKIEEVKR